MGNLTNREFRLMQGYIKDTCGIALGEEKAYLIESRLSKTLVEFGLSSYEELYHRLAIHKDARIKERVIDAITTNETLWFRDKTPWRILEEVLLPRFIEEIQNGKRNKVRIWSAACSTGQEPYSIAMSIDKFLSENIIRGVSSKHFEILGTDISNRALNIAKAGKYDSISIMRGLDSEYRDKYFQKKDRDWILSENIRRRVEFRQFNLQKNFITLGKFDIVFLRYVTIYFSQDLKKEIIQKMSGVLNRPYGVLFLGSSEIFTEHGDNFLKKAHDGGVYYKAIS